jgi:hypothetical protein
MIALQEQQKKLGQVIAKAWADPVFKERLKADPKPVLAELGVETPEGVAIDIVENTASKIYLTLPAAPPSDLLSDEEIERIGSSQQPSVSCPTHPQDLCS